MAHPLFAVWIGRLGRDKIVWVGVGCDVVGLSSCGVSRSWCFVDLVVVSRWCHLSSYVSSFPYLLVGFPFLRLSTGEVVCDIGLLCVRLSTWLLWGVLFLGACGLLLLG